MNNYWPLLKRGNRMRWFWVVPLLLVVTELKMGLVYSDPPGETPPLTGGPVSEERSSDQTPEGPSGSPPARLPILLPVEGKTPHSPAPEEMPTKSVPLKGEKPSADAPEP